MHYNFTQDLQEGEQIEQEVCQVFGFKKECVGNQYDLVDSDKRTYEVKYDILASETGNFAIEFKCRGRLSGLSVSRAAVYIFVTENHYYFVSTEGLKALLHEKKMNRTLRVTKGGDGRQSQMILLPISELPYYLKRERDKKE